MNSHTVCAEAPDSCRGAGTDDTDQTQKVNAIREFSVQSVAFSPLLKSSLINNKLA